MSDQIKSQRALRAAALCLALAGAFALPHANAQAANELTQDDAVVVRDKDSGKLRAATPEEHNALRAARKAKIAAMRIAPEPMRSKHHRSGAAGLRLNDDMINSATVVRAADGTLVHECQDAAGHANHTPHAVTPAPNTVTE